MILRMEEVHYANLNQAIFVARYWAVLKFPK